MMTSRFGAGSRSTVDSRAEMYGYNPPSVATTSLGNAASHFSRLPSQRTNSIDRPSGNDGSYYTEPDHNRMVAPNRRGTTNYSNTSSLSSSQNPAPNQYQRAEDRYSYRSSSGSSMDMGRNISIGVASTAAMSTQHQHSRSSSGYGGVPRMLENGGYPPRYSGALHNPVGSPGMLDRTQPDLKDLVAAAARSLSPEIHIENARLQQVGGRKDIITHHHQHRAASRSITRTLPTPTTINAQVLRQCIRKCFMPCALRASYFRKWQGFPEVKYNREKLLHRLRSIAKRSLVALLLSSFKRLERQVYHRRSGPRLEVIARTALGHLVSSTFAKWEYFWHLRVTERRTAPRLRALLRSAKVSLGQRCFQLLWEHRTYRVQRRARAVALAMNTKLIAASEWFRRWVRARYVRSRPQILNTYNRRIQRNGARIAFRRWVSWAVSRRLAVVLEQRNFKILAYRYLTRKWMAHFQHSNNVAILQDMVAFEHTRTTFDKWRTWMNRSIIASREEQRNMVNLMQRYYFKWRRHHTRATLSFSNLFPPSQVPSSAAASESRDRSQSGPFASEERDDETRYLHTDDDLRYQPTHQMVLSRSSSASNENSGHTSHRHHEERQEDMRPNIRRPPRPTHQHVSFASLSFKPEDDQFDLDEDIVYMDTKRAGNHRY